MSEVKVKIMKEAGRKVFTMYWLDPDTHLRKVKSTKQTKRRDAERMAARHEDELCFALAKCQWHPF